MNVPDEKSAARADRPQPAFGRVWALLALAGGQLFGCADIQRATSLPPVNPESPVAGLVAAAAMQNYSRPTLQSVPPRPLNIPPPAAVKSAVIGMVRCRRTYEIWVAAHPAMVSGSVPFAESLQARLDNNPDDRPTPAENAAAEADAAKLRAYAEPPAPMDHGPPLSAAQAASPAMGGSATPSPHPLHAAVPARTAAAAPRATTSVAQGAAPTPSQETAEVVKPSMSPLYGDPLLAHCQ